MAGPPGVAEKEGKAGMRHEWPWENKESGGSMGMLRRVYSCEEVGGIKGKEAAEWGIAKSKVLPMEQIWIKIGERTSRERRRRSQLSGGRCVHFQVALSRKHLYGGQHFRLGNWPLELKSWFCYLLCDLWGICVSDFHLWSEYNNSTYLMGLCHILQALLEEWVRRGKCTINVDRNNLTKETGESWDL